MAEMTDEMPDPLEEYEDLMREIRLCSTELEVAHEEGDQDRIKVLRETLVYLHEETLDLKMRMMDG
jgi:hypothetical protein